MFFWCFPNCRDLPASNSLFYSDSTLGDTYLKFLLKRSRTDQKGKGRWIFISKISDSSICACHFTYEYLLIRPQSKSHLFIHLNGLLLTQYQFSAVLKKCLVKLQLDL